MRVAFLASEKSREQLLGRAFVEGLRVCGDRGKILPADTTRLANGYDAVAMVGVKSRVLFRDHMGAGFHVIMIDKGYLRHRAASGGVWEYWRVALDAHHPTQHLVPMPSERWSSLGIKAQPWREDGKHIVIAGSSAKYHDFYGMPNPTTYARSLVREIRRHTDRPIVYRPKPSWKDAEPIDGTIYSSANEKINSVLKNAWAVVTHGSNACYEAVLAGVPCVVLGDAVARPISSTDLSEIEAPRLATEAERSGWLSSLAWWQWKRGEFANGMAWANIKRFL